MNLGHEARKALKDYNDQILISLQKSQEEARPRLAKIIKEMLPDIENKVLDAAKNGHDNITYKEIAKQENHLSAVFKEEFEKIILDCDISITNGYPKISWDGADLRWIKS